MLPSGFQGGLLCSLEQEPATPLLLPVSALASAGARFVLSPYPCSSQLHAGHLLRDLIWGVLMHPHSQLKPEELAEVLFLLSRFKTQPN